MFQIFRKISLKIPVFHFSGVTKNAENFPMNSIILSRNLSKNLKNGLDRELLLEMG